MQTPATTADAIKAQIHQRISEREVEKRKMEVLRARLKELEKQLVRAK
jgi:hypothetical protein